MLIGKVENGVSNPLVFVFVGVRVDGHAAEQSPTTYGDSKFKNQNVVVKGSLVGDNTNKSVSTPLCLSG